MTEIGLVSCTDRKRSEPARPRDIYDESPLFRKTRAYCERNHDGWFVISAKHGLLEPDGAVIDPYDLSMYDLSAEDRRAWAADVAADLEPRLPDDATLVVHAGKKYYEPLLDAMDGVPAEIPTEGLQIGDTMAWYDEQDTDE